LEKCQNSRQLISQKCNFRTSCAASLPAHPFAMDRKSYNYMPDQLMADLLFGL